MIIHRKYDRKSVTMMHTIKDTYQHTLLGRCHSTGTSHRHTRKQQKPGMAQIQGDHTQTPQRCQSHMT